MATGGSDCDNNSVDAEALLRFTLGTLRELTDRLGAREKLMQKLLERAYRDEPDDPLQSLHEQERVRLEQSVSALERQLKAAQRNLAIEENPEYRQTIREEFERIRAEMAASKTQLAAVSGMPTRRPYTPEEEAEAAIHLLDDIRQVATDPAGRAAISPLLQRLGLRIGLQFVDGIKGKKRRVRRLAGGVLAFGATPLPDGCAGLPGDPTADHSVGTGDGRSPRNGCKNHWDGGNKEKASESSLLLAEARRPKLGPQEGVSFTKGSRGDRRLTFLNDVTGAGLFQLAIAQVEEFQADTFFALGSAED
jgi:hypothetical protein